MSVKTKIISGFVVIFIMIVVQSFMLTYINGKKDIITDQAMTIYQSSMTMREVMLDNANLMNDLRYHIISDLEIPQKDTWVRYSCVKINQRLIEWQSQYIKTAQFSVLGKEQQQAILDMQKFFIGIESSIDRIRALNPVKDESKRQEIYDVEVFTQISSIQNLIDVVLDKNAIDFSIKNKDMQAYSAQIKMYIYIMIGLVILFIIGAVFYSNKILYPLNWLMEGVHSIKSGDYNYKVKKVSNDELGQLADQFNIMGTEIRSHREHLEELVNERTRQLSEAKEQLETAFLDLKSTHGALVEVRRIADLDMKMAVSIQDSIFIKDPPSNDEWDLAFLFRPLSGVSGDMYDFYTTPEGDLVGVALMDVSGHGISSGLITMIAKSVAHRSFVYGEANRLRLNQTLVRLNDELIAEIGSVDNYLTGIVLKLVEDEVEYVNAGHPDIIIKKKETGKSYIVAPQSAEFKGRFLGMEAMRFSESELKSIKFKVNEGDIICLYSDCLMESTNVEGEEFGMQRVQAAMNSVDEDASAKEVVNHLLSNLYKWVGSDKLRDDLTMIVLRRKGGSAGAV